MQSNNELEETFTPGALSTDVQDVKSIAEGFNVPALNGQSTMELQDEVSTPYLQACLKMANRAMTGSVNVFKEGDLPHKMALLLAMKMLPNRKIGDKQPQDTPEQNKKVARALKSLIKSLTSDGEAVVDSHSPANADVDDGDSLAELAQQQAVA